MAKQLTTPEEFIAYYYNKLKDELEVFEIRLSKTGFIGFFLNLLGNLQFDIKNYYDYLFKESFPITALDDKNILYHARLYNYFVDFAKYSKIQGRFVININGLPKLGSDVEKREIKITNATMIVDTIPFTLASSYTIVQNRISTGNSEFFIKVVDVETNKTNIYPLAETNPSVEIFGFYQYITQDGSVKIPIYVFGSHYSFTMSINNDEFLSGVDAFVNDEQYSVSFTKNFASSSDKVVFVSRTQNNKILIEVGSGIRGTYIPNSVLKIKLYKTFGAKGNISSKKSQSMIAKLFIVDHNVSGINPVTLTVENGSTVLVDIDNARGGVDTSSGDVLRNELLEYIQTRNNLISEQDYIDIFEQRDTAIIFNKSDIVNNVIGLYNNIITDIGIPLYTTTQMVTRNEFESGLFGGIWVKYPEFSIGGKTLLSPFVYRRDNVVNFYAGYILPDDPVFYPEKITKSTELVLEDPVGLFLRLTFDELAFLTTIELHSPNDISNILSVITVDKYPITGEKMKTLDSNTKIITYQGFIENPSGVNIRSYRSSFGDLFTVAADLSSGTFPLTAIQNTHTCFALAGGSRLDILKLVSSVNLVPGTILSVPDKGSTYVTSVVRDADFVLDYICVFPGIHAAWLLTDIVFWETPIHTGTIISELVSAISFINVSDFCWDIENTSADVSKIILHVNPMEFGLTVGTKLSVTNKIDTYVIGLDGLTNTICTSPSIYNSWVVSDDIMWVNPYDEIVFSDVSNLIDVSDTINLKFFNDNPQLQPNPAIPSFGGSNLFDVTYLQAGVDSSYNDFVFIPNLPLVDKEIFDINRGFYISKLLGNNAQVENMRTVSDDIQIRLLNTWFVSANILEIITNQHYNFDLYLPLKIKSVLTVDKEYLINNRLNVVNEIELLKDDIGLFLANEAGVNMNHYDTELISKYHEYPWIKTIETELYDSSPIISGGRLIQGGDMVVIDQIDKIGIISSTLGKNVGLGFCPVFFWFDINNIDITYKFES